MRFTVQPNGAGGWEITDNRHPSDFGPSCSHRSNAQIIADRLNFSEGAERADWFRFYRIKEGASA